LFEVFNRKKVRVILFELGRVLVIFVEEIPYFLGKTVSGNKGNFVTGRRTSWEMMFFGILKFENEVRFSAKPFNISKENL